MGKHQSKPQKVCEKEKFMLEYTTTHTPQLNSVIKRISTVIKEGVLDMLLNAKLNDTAQKMLWSESVHM